MIIHCDTMADFYRTIQELTERGIRFEAHTSDRTIKLTGGF